MARYDLRIAECEFWKLTPHKLEVLLDHFRKHLRREQILLGVLRADLINHSACRPKRPVGVKDLVPDWKETPTKRVQRGKRKRMTAKRRAAMCEMMRTALVGLPGVKFTPGY